MLKGRIQKELNTALKQQARLERSVLQLLNSVIHNKEIDKKAKLRKTGELSEEQIAKEGELTDEEVIELISRELKKRKEAILDFEKGDRADLVEKEKKEIEILKKYLPKQLSKEEITKLTREAIKKLGAKDIKDTGKIMGELMPKVKGRAQGREISNIVKELLKND